ncbi:MAG TPA: peptide-methionine (R)-S-oxide reductase MsrB [Nitrososphaeraceae archaeon]
MVYSEQKKVNKTDEEWKKQLTEVCRRKGTELPFTGGYYNSKEKGVYRCVCCGNELFSSDNKFDSNTGWPSSTRAGKFENIKMKLDLSHGMIRKEVKCTKCGAHLGHVFDGGPAPIRKRYCKTLLH